MSKTHAVTANKDKPKSKLNPTTSVTKKPTVPVTGSKNLKPAVKKPLSETKPNPAKSIDENNLRQKPPTTKNTIPQKTRTNASSNATKPGNQQLGVLRKQQSIEKTSKQTVRAKNASSKVDLSRSNHTNAKTSLKPSKPNAVLDTYHSVTVASPPPTRKKEIKNAEIPEDFVEPTESSEKRTRTRTRTLDPDEVVVLRNESAKQRIQAEIQAQSEVKRHSPVKDAVAFEVSFENPNKASARSRDASKVRTKRESASSGEDGDANYSDDFESYESDFETGSSSPTASTESEDDEEEAGSIGEDKLTQHDELPYIQDVKQNVNKVLNDEDDDDDESELTQYPITVIHREKELERKLDSGNYEMHSSKQARLAEGTLQLQQQFDSLDTFSGATSEQLDSGISSYGNTAQQLERREEKAAIFYGGYVDFNTRPYLSERGLELMSKIQFDTLSFTLFELKPISYDVFMQTYGKLNTTQSCTQTNENRMTTECQTEDYELRSIWTQHPALYDLQTVQELTIFGGPTAQNCCGEFAESSTEITLSKKDELDGALQSLVAFRQSSSNKDHQLRSLRKPIDFERLHAFLLNASTVMSRVLDCGNAERHIEAALRQPSQEFSAFSRGYSPLNTSFLNALRVVRVFSSARHSLVITVHESLPEADVYRSDFSNLLMVWSTSEISKPIRLLSAWSEVCRAEICNETPDIVVCGLRDGSVAMWDLRETYSFCSKLDGYLTHFAATQSIVPTWNTSDEKVSKLVDMGAVVDVKSFRSRPKTVGMSNSLARYKSIQFASLNDTGILTIWTLVETTPNEYELPVVPPSKGNRKVRTPRTPNARFEYSSPWARVKLIQSAICDLRTHLEQGILKTQSNFDRTKFLFEKNIYSDEILRELNETQSDLVRGDRQLQGLRFTCIDTGCELIYVCTNRNFILICSKTLKTEKFRKISINEDRFLFPTALRVLTNEDFLAVGLSNGSVMILNCNQSKTTQKKLRLQEDSQRKEEAFKTPKSNEVRNSDLDIGKSCAIQNIILNERRSFENGFPTEDYDLNSEARPTTAAFIGLISNQKKPFELRVFDQQTVLSGSMLRKHLVQSLELSSDGWRLFALSDGEVRAYDFYLDREVTTSQATSSEGKKSRVMDVTIARTSESQQNLVALAENGEVEVHVLKQ